MNSEPTFVAATNAWRNGPLAESLVLQRQRAAEFNTLSGLPVEPLYVPAASQATGYLQNLGFPGEYPFTRGVQPTMYRGRLWTMRQYAGFGTADETNERFRYLLSQGGTGLSVAFDLPTQIGYDCDSPAAEGEVGKVGVSISSLADMERLFSGIPLDRVSTSMTINATAAILLAMYVVVAEKQGVSPAAINGTVQNDILKEYIARGTYRYRPEPSLRLTRDLFSWCAEHAPKWNTISISGYHIREAGSTAAQEIGFTLADAICYIESALSAGLSIDDFAPRLTFFFAAHTDLLEEVAKFRAARRLYARLMRERFGSQLARSGTLRFHTQTGGVTLTAQQPENNVVRVAIQALAAVLGGTQSLHTNSKDEALSLPTEDAVTVALRTQQIIAHESGIANTVDPLGGSYFIEDLTNRLEAEAEAYIDTIDALGGMVAAIEQGYPQHEIEQAAYTYQRSVDDGTRKVVGINCFQDTQGPSLPLFRVNEQLTAQQVAALAAVRSSRDTERVNVALETIATAAADGTNVMPPIIAAVREYATIGEICQTLERVFGHYHEACAVV